MSDEYRALSLLATAIDKSKQTGEHKTYIGSLLQMGMKAIGSRVMEEASEFVIAAHQLEPQQEERPADLQQDLVGKAADLILHSLVMLAHNDLALSDVTAELQRRFDQPDQNELLT